MCVVSVNFNKKIVQPGLLFVPRPMAAAYLKYIVLKESALPCSSLPSRFLTSCRSRIILPALLSFAWVRWTQLSP